ncbi:uncharacterized protein LOC114351631 [Ostrinia furnacalis]|uniref:uncharacterized protein LOC114351631 n=1 Tax=Ostrinia furnacalis TaxID=93504 RepID=UPI00103EA689|nr:uncharacterized protein LOC114351631 [Ostrinia furnacalis]
MNLVHSPNKKGSSDAQVTQRKRKQHALDDDLRNEMTEFRTESMSFLKDFRTAHDQDVKDMRSDLNEIKNDICSLRTDMHKMKEEHSNFKKELSSIVDSIEYQSKEQNDLKSCVDLMKEDLTLLKTTENELAECKKQLGELTEEYQIQQQRERLNNLEISGIPKSHNENLSQHLHQICQVLGLVLCADDIIHIHRVPTRVSNNPKLIIVKFKSQLIKDSIISAIRKKKALTTKEIGMGGEDRRIYVNEHLTPYYKALYRKTRELASKSSFQFVWIRNCKIYVRRNDTSPSFFIKTQKDLEKLK